MKKAITLILILTMAFALACSNNSRLSDAVTYTPADVMTVQPETSALVETPGPQEQFSDELTYDEILALPKESIESDYVFYKTLDEEWNSRSNINYGISVIAGEAVSVKYYFYIERYDVPEYNYICARPWGCALIEFVVSDVADQYNSIGIKPGDRLTIYQRNYIEFANHNETLDFLSAKLGKRISAYKDVEPPGSGMLEMIPKKNVAYKLNTFVNEYPVKEGERYTMFIGYHSYEEGVFGGLCIKPMNDEIDLEAFSKEYGFTYYKDAIALAEEIAALFK